MPKKTKEIATAVFLGAILLARTILLVIELTNL